MLSVVELTAVTVRVTLVMVRALKVRVSGRAVVGQGAGLQAAAVAEGQGGGR